MKANPTWLVAALLLVLTSIVIAGIVMFRSIEPEAGQTTLRNDPGQTWGTGFRKEGEAKNVPPNVRPETPSGARDATQPGGGNAPTGQGGPASSGSAR
jgi:hypothetical protein